MAARFLVAGGNGNWNDTSNWAATSGGASGASFPVAADSVAFDSLSGNANMTVNVASACTSLVMSGTYAGTLTFNSTLTATTTATFISTCTIAGTAGTLILSGNMPLTSGGKTLTCALSLTSGSTYVLGDNWTVNGLVTSGSGTSSPTINANQMTCAGGFRQGGSSATTAGTAKLVITGGTWDSTSTGATKVNVDLAGNVTISGTVAYDTNTLAYVSGTITTTGSTLTLNAAATLNTAGVTWNNVSFTSGVSYSLSSNLVWSGTLNVSFASTFTGAGTLSGTGAVTTTNPVTLTFNNTGGLVTTGTYTLPNANVTFAGSSGFTVGTLTTATLTTNRTFTLTFGNTYTVTNSLTNVGTTASILQTIKSSSAGNKVVFKLSTAMSAPIRYCNATDVDSSGGQTVYTYNGVLSNTTNWVNANATRFLVSGGTGNWNSTTNWSLIPGGVSGAAFPVAGDDVEFDTASANANVTVNAASACSSLVMIGTYAGTITFNDTLTLTSTCTFVSTCTIAGTAGTLICTGTATLTSAGKTLTCGLTFSSNLLTYTLADNWVVNGLVQVGNVGTATITVNANQITCAGGFRHGGGNTLAAGTTKYVLTGGTWDSTNPGRLANSVDLAGNVTVSGTVIYGGGTLTYLSGTVTTAGSTLSVANSSGTTLATSGVTWNNVSMDGVSVSYTFSNTFAWSGTLSVTGNTQTWAGAGTVSGTGGIAFTNSTSLLTLNNTGGLVTTGTMTLPNNALTLAGTSGFTVGTLTTAALNGSRTYTLTFGNTYRVTTALGNVTTATFRQAIISSSPGNKVVFNVTPGATMTLAFCDPTDVDSSGGAQVVSVLGTITTSLNWLGSYVTPAGGGLRKNSPLTGGTT